MEFSHRSYGYYDPCAFLPLCQTVFCGKGAIAVDVRSVHVLCSIAC